VSAFKRFYQKVELRRVNRFHRWNLLEKAYIPQREKITGVQSLRETHSTIM